MNRKALQPVLLPALIALFTIGSAITSFAAAPAGLHLWSEGDPDPTYPFSDRYPVVVVTATEEAAREIANAGIDVESVGLHKGQWIVQANINTVEHSDIEGAGHEVYRLRNLALEMHRSLPEGPRDWTDWPTFAEFEAEMHAIAAANTDICRLYSLGQSVQGRDLWIMKITDNPDVAEVEPEFKYTSTMHGDEVVGMDLCVRLLNLMVDEYGSDPTITSYINGIEIWICPLHNPDGYVNGTRFNANGYDLNREFPDRTDDPVDDPAGRPIEVQHMMYFGYDHRFILSANLHGGELVVNYPWDNPYGSYTPDHDMIHNFALGYSILNPPMWNSPSFPNGVTIGWEWYVIYGGMQDWCYNWRDEIDFTLELSSNKWPPYSQMDGFWDDNRDAMLWLMGRSLIGVSGRVYDEDTLQPLDATVDVLEIGKSIRTDDIVGDYHRLLEPGTYTLYVEAFGYVPETIPGVVVVDGPATHLDIPMGRWPTYDISGTVTEEGTGDPLAADIKVYLNSTQQLVNQTSTEPSTGEYSLGLTEETYDLRVTSEGHIPETRTIVVTGDRTENFVLADAGGSVLVVQDGATTRIADDLALLGVSVVTESDDVTDPEAWTDYSLLIWSAGGNLDPVATATIRDALEAHVAGGGNLLIEGGQIGYDAFRTPGYPSFGANVLHCSDWDVSDAGNLNVVATGHALATTPNTLPGQFAINYSAVGDNDAIEHLPEATLIYGTAAYPADAGILAYDDDPGTPAKGQIVYYAFNYDALDSAVDARDLLENTVEYLGSDLSGLPDGTPIALDWLGPAYPNPALDVVHFRLRLPQNGEIAAALFDLQGRRVWQRAPLDGSEAVLTWDGRTSAGRTVPSGIYFLRLQGDGKSAEQRFLWLRP